MKTHPKKCDCAPCAEARLEAFKTRLAALASMGEFARLPTETTQTVFVKAHFRKQPNHLKRFPRTLALFRKTLKGVI